MQLLSGGLVIDGRFYLFKGIETFGNLGFAEFSKRHLLQICIGRWQLWLLMFRKLFCVLQSFMLPWPSGLKNQTPIRFQSWPYRGACVLMAGRVIRMWVPILAHIVVTCVLAGRSSECGFHDPGQDRGACVLMARPSHQNVGSTILARIVVPTF